MDQGTHFSGGRRILQSLPSYLFPEASGLGAAAALMSEPENMRPTGVGHGAGEGLTQAPPQEL